MKANLPWGHSDYEMTVRLTRDEVRRLVYDMSTFANVPNATRQFCDTIKEELDKTETIERELEEARHEPNVRLITTVDHHGYALGKVPVCLDCDTEVVEMMDGSYKHAKDAS